MNKTEILASDIVDALKRIIPQPHNDIETTIQLLMNHARQSHNLLNLESSEEHLKALEGDYRNNVLRCYDYDEEKIGNLELIKHDAPKVYEFEFNDSTFEFTSCVEYVDKDKIYQIGDEYILQLPLDEQLDVDVIDKYISEFLKFMYNTDCVIVKHH